MSENMTIENTPELLSFMQLWMMSGPMVLSTVNEIAESNRAIDLPEIPGRNFAEELRSFHSSMAQITTRLL
ncbi:MAG: hypothetical protein ACKVJ7_07185 [Candidatus Poseidoniales archaeon]|jgi:hypothetical protein